jgi:hypothetical protein
MDRSRSKLLVLLIVVLALAAASLAGFEGLGPDGWTWDSVPSTSA